MRSSEFLRREISLRRRLADLQREAGETTEGWGRLAHQRNRQQLARANRQLSEVGGDLEWAFDGVGVYADRIAMGRLVSLADPLAQALRWTGRDILFLEGGGPVAGVELKDLVEPVVTGTFSGASFGLRLSRAPVLEQLSIFEEPLFNRVAERVVTIFRAATGEESPSAVLDELTGLRQRTLNGLRSLAERLAESGGQSRIRWRGDTVVVVAPDDAQLLAETLSQVEPREADVTIQAVLQGADLGTGSFHLVVVTSEGEKHYRGRSEPEAIPQLRGLGLGTRVSATLRVVLLDSPLLEEPRESYVLRQIEPRGQEAEGKEVNGPN